MAADPIAFALAAYLLTYLIHSTLLLVGAWSLETVFEFRSVRLRERLWRVALLGGFVTAGLQLGLGLQTPMQRWVLQPASGVALLSEAAPAADARLGRVLSHAAPRRSAERAAAVRALEGSIPSAVPGPGTPPALAVPPAAKQPGVLDAGVWPFWMALGFGALSLAALALLALSAARLRGRLRGAAELTSGAEVAALAELARRAGLTRPVRLLVAPALRSPLTSGLWRPIICVPPRALAELGCEEREAMLAHELGHVARRDPAWLTFYWLIARACFFQPLNLLARRRLSVAAELLADDWAVRHTGRYLPLASCLARIAAWIKERPRLLTAHMTLAAESGQYGQRTRSLLGRRIERLLEERSPADEPLRRWWPPAAAGLLASLALVAPGVAAHRPALAALPLRAPAEVEPAERAADLGGALEATLAEDLAALDLEVELLGQELSLLRGDLTLFESDPGMARALRGLEQHARALSERRDRLQALIRLSDPRGAGPDNPRLGDLQP